MTFNYNPYSGVNDLRFDMSRDEIRGALGLIHLYKEFHRTKSSNNTTDSFYQLGLFVNYNEAERCDSFEFHSNAKVIFIEVNLMNLSYKEFVNFIKSLDEEVVEDESGCTSFILGVGAYAPNKEENPDEKVEGIIVFKKGYYD